MKKLAAIIFTFACLSLLTTKTASAAPVQWLDNGHYYEVVNGFSYWSAANTAASSAAHLGLSGHLATVTSVNEETWLTSTFGDLSGYLLGATDAATDGDWQWITGEDWDYTNWRDGEPNNGASNTTDEDYLQFHPAGGGWNDIGDYNSPAHVYGYIVEYETATTNAVPEPASLSLLSLGLLGFALKKKRTV